jgi:hypothetical protein
MHASKLKWIYLNTRAEVQGPLFRQDHTGRVEVFQSHAFGLIEIE